MKSTPTSVLPDATVTPNDETISFSLPPLSSRERGTEEAEAEADAKTETDTDAASESDAVFV